MKHGDPAVVEEVVRAAYDAMLARDLDRLRLMLHPYLHWIAPTVRGYGDGARLWIA